ncbi:tetratricopeptide repeat [Elysia marginata]|uniref:Tetratricopeptide repeat n=1 Tax=Elysia marginata TaxID=1093978 RepID=A0AAV4IP40_9GAST|nr:tetratricopeptide repeat [Elysia marginata]
MGETGDSTKSPEKQIVDNTPDDLNNNDTDGQETTTTDLQLGDTSILTVTARNELFQRGLEYERQDKPNLALQCYLGCINGLKSKSYFVLLPQCLHNIAQIYRDQENYERAIHFAQAEKLFYETSLIETEEIQKKIEEVATGVGDGPKDINDLNIHALQAEEYEHLAKLCLDKNQQQLALEYAGKSTKLKQAVYGRDHEKTKASLNMFAALYAEVGKLQYSDSINILNENDSPDSSSVDAFPLSDKKATESIEPVSILRQRSEDGSREEDQRKRKQVHFHKSVDESQRQKEREEMASFTVTLMVLGICICILASMGMWLYCSLDKSRSCEAYTVQLRGWVRNVQYFFHTFTGSGFTKHQT